MRTGLAAVALAIAALAGAARAAEPPAKPDAEKTTLKLRAKSIVFDKGKGEMILKGDAHVVRTTGDQTLTMDSDDMTATLKDDKLETVHATGNVVLVTTEYRASAQRADVDFAKNVIHLYAGEKKTASVTTSGMTSTGAEIIFFLQDQRVELPKGGDTVINMKEQEKK